MPKNHAQLIREFLTFNYNNESITVNNLKIEYRRNSIALIYFETIVAEYEMHEKILHINVTEYSLKTMQRVQSMFSRYLKHKEIEGLRVKENGKIMLGNNTLLLSSYNEAIL